MLDRYELLAALSDDGISRTWSARSRDQTTQVELDELDPYVAQVSEFRDAFLREATVVRRAAHPALLTYTAASIATGSVFGVRAARPATTLRALLARTGPLPPAVATRVAIAVLEAIAPIAALSSPGRPVCHGDVTPSSVLVTAAGEVLVVATCLGVAAARPDSPAPERAHVRIGYKAPEQVRPSTGVARTIDARADAFAVGAILWEALVGRTPFEAPSAAAIAARILGEPAALPEPARSLPGLQAALARALAPDVGARATPELLLGSLRLVPGVATADDAARELAARVAGDLDRAAAQLSAPAAPMEIEVELEVELEPDPDPTPHAAAASKPEPVLEAAPVRPPHARERPPAPPSEAQYVAPRAIGSAARVAADEPQASIVLNVPTTGATSETEVLASRARRRLATMKIDRAAIPGLLAMDASLRGGASSPESAMKAPPAASAFVAPAAPIAPAAIFSGAAPNPSALAPEGVPRRSAGAIAAVVVAIAALILVGALAVFFVLSHGSADAASPPANAAGATAR